MATKHVFRTTHEQIEGDRVIQRSEVQIHFTYQRAEQPTFDPVRGGSPGGPAEIEFIKAEILCGPGTESRITRSAPAHIVSWAEHYCRDFDDDLIREAESDIAAQRAAADDAWFDRRKDERIARHAA
ncbi:hypothetical protein TSA6c_17180 [Azospirillum sp. TSA6c]|uniref:hypothetical protein n=1 Tax=Azospirillum sp. TSA6c TaxID=709813 RepID=UPI000D60E52D|nr:hypothetical protein [Azospirillum sp. TSA6c]PWC48162.1 hypothetical protein TSA6c_17180 [Azospirillum sp. TSA6c]